jgi:hypothetical protein
MEASPRNPSPCFIGYGRLEDLVAAHSDPAQPFYVEFTVQRTQGDPLGWATEAVTVQDFDDRGNVRYCRIQFGGYHLMGGQPFEEEVARKVFARSKDGFERITEYLAASGFKIERAMVAAPRDLILLMGSAGFLCPALRSEGAKPIASDSPDRTGP